jgi:hypothetical protein
LNDYARGALEAMAWFLGMLEDDAELGRVRREVEAARDDLLAGVTVDFRGRLRSIR